MPVFVCLCISCNHVTWCKTTYGLWNSRSRLLWQLEVLCGSNPAIHKFYKTFGSSRNSRRRKGTWRKFHTEDPQILGVTLRNLVPWNISTPDLVHLHLYQFARQAETSTQTNGSCLHFVFTSLTLHEGSALANRSSAQYRFFCTHVKTCKQTIE